MKEEGLRDSIQMRVDHGAYQTIQSGRQPRKKYVMRSRNVVRSEYPFIRQDIKPEVFERFLLGAPGKCESSQALVFTRGSPKVESVKAFVRQKLYGFPDDKIVPAKAMVPFV